MTIRGILRNGIFALKGNREGIKYIFYYVHYSNEDKEVIEWYPPVLSTFMVILLNMFPLWGKE
jgi:hypothetical protein